MVIYENLPLVQGVRFLLIYSLYNKKSLIARVSQKNIKIGGDVDPLSFFINNQQHCPCVATRQKNSLYVPS